MRDSNYNLKGNTPIFRIFDVVKAKEFYINYLPFKLDWQHQFEENFPLYLQISHGNCILHLSEHHGDCSPGSSVRIEVDGIATLHKNLTEKEYKFAKPSLESTPWNTQEMQVTDPFGNKINFYENIKL